MDVGRYSPNGDRATVRGFCNQPGIRRKGQIAVEIGFDID